MPRTAAKIRPRPAGRSKLPSVVRTVVASALLIIAFFYAACILGMVALRFVHPLTTGVQIQRRIEAMAQGHPYQKRYNYVPLDRISPHLQHAAIAAEDGRFFQHHGFDWVEMEKVLERDAERRKLGRGASTITQQLVKNLFLTTERSLLRKGIEASLVPVAEIVLGKNRILELYLNVIEWGPGAYGAEAAAEFYYHQHAAQIGRDEAARLAAIIPAPLRRKPDHMDQYSAIILARLDHMGW
jgi:monofunctional biosynthetic peptidoglycan transglycosylase